MQLKTYPSFDPKTDLRHKVAGHKGRGTQGRKDISAQEHMDQET